MVKILRTAASRFAQGGSKYAEQRKKAQRRLRKCMKNELDDPPSQKLNYRLRLIFSIFLFSLLTFTLCTAPCAFAANGTLTQEDGYYLIEDAKDLAAFRDGVNNGTLASANARLTADIDLSVYENWTPIGNETNKYAGIFDGRGHAINGLAVNITDASGNILYAGLFGYIDGGTVKNITVSGSIQVVSDVYSVIVGGIVGDVENGSVENCKSSVSVSTSYKTVSIEQSVLAGGIAGFIEGGKVVNCESSGGVKATVGEYGERNTPINFVGGIAGINSGGEIDNCTSSGDVEAYGANDMMLVNAGGIVGSNQKDVIGESGAIVSNCVSSSKVTSNGLMGDPKLGVSCSRVGGITGLNDNNCTLKNCIVMAESVSGRDAEDERNASSVVFANSGTVTNCAWVENDKMPKKGIYCDPTSSAVTTELDNADLLANAVTSLTASIDPSTITKEGTAAITLTTGPGTPENAFDETSGAVRSIALDESYNKDVVTVAQGDNAASYTVTPVASGSTDITITAELYTVDFSTLDSTPAYNVGPEKYTFTLPVTVAAEAAPSQPGTSGGSGSTGGGGGGGCSTGFGALALLAAVPLLFRRKK